MPFPAHVPSGQKQPAQPGQAWIDRNLAALRCQYPQMWIAATDDGFVAGAANIDTLISILPEELRWDPRAPYTVRFIDS
jgi:hypothetical protein